MDAELLNILQARPPMMDIGKLIRLEELLKRGVKYISEESGIPAQTIYSKLRRGTPLTDDESRAIDLVFLQLGIQVY